MPERIDRVAVVVPARDEEALMGGCLDSLARARSSCRLPVHVVLVADGCTDRTADRARAAGADVLEIAASGVGRARSLGAERALDVAGTQSLWLAFTDADSRVPPTWLSHQLGRARDGADAVVGTVVLRADDEIEHGAWWRQYAQGLLMSEHRHVHGANLGVHADAYRSVGGFRPLHSGEDHDLVTRLLCAGLRVDRTLDAPVMTSARTTGRAPGGVAADLRLASAPTHSRPGSSPVSTSA